MKITLFDDHHVSRFHPLTLTRPMDNLRVGIYTIREKWAYHFPEATIKSLTQPVLMEIFNGNSPKESDDNTPHLFINGRSLPDAKLVDAISNLKPGEVLRHEDILLAVSLDQAKAKAVSSVEDLDQLNNVTIKPYEHPMVLSHLWELFQWNGDAVERDIPIAKKRAQLHHPDSSANLSQPHAIYIEEGAVIEPGVLLLADDGPIFIGRNAKVLAGAMIKGPTAICGGAVIKMGAKIYGKTTIGPVCKVGGEVNNSIFHSYSNKGHDGFVGNSLIGQWCNLGADTNTSNLKNNYGPVRIHRFDSGELYNTGQQFIGTIMGDHSKTAINTMLNTGTICGVSTNIFSAHFPPKHLPSFGWVGTDRIDRYRFDKALETMERMMSRRNISLSEAYRKMKALYERSEQ